MARRHLLTIKDSLHTEMHFLFWIHRGVTTTTMEGCGGYLWVERSPSYESNHPCHKFTLLCQSQGTSSLLLGGLLCTSTPRQGFLIRIVTLLVLILCRSDLTMGLYFRLSRTASPSRSVQLGRWAAKNLHLTNTTEHNDPIP